MKRTVLSIIALLALYASPTFAEGGACAGCEAAGKAQERTVKGKGKPDPSAVCFYVLMNDPADSVAVTITYGQGSGEGKPITFPRGAAQAMSGDKDAPMVCIPASKLKGATQVVAIPGSKEGCAVLRTPHVAELLKKRHMSEEHPACLLKEEQCRKWFGS